jgi:SWI/SNF-related matrix-associated actin-dependent regulator 1 of chromatin subfamily A
MAPKVIIIDECQRIKNRTAKRTRACTGLAKTTEHIIALSGTPITNRAAEFFPVLQIIEPKQFPSWWRYAFRYCAPKRAFRGRGWDFSGASNTEELHQQVSRIMIRRMKTEVLKELPLKTRTIIPVDIDNRADYEKAKKDFIQWLAKKKGSDAAIRASRAEAVVKLGALKHLAAEGKVYRAVEYITEWLEDTQNKLVVFGIHHSIIDRLTEAFPHAAVVTGQVSTTNRLRAVDRFQMDPQCRLFLGNIQAAGEGITLHAASDMLVLELGWTPAEHDQAEDRINRIGQTADHVSIRYMVARNTIEESILKLIEAKRDVVGKIIDGGRAATVPMIIMDELLKGNGNAKTANKKCT